MDPRWRRFWAKVDVVQSGCWLWTAGKFPNGYGCFSLGGKPRRNALAHRFAYEQLVGPILEGLEIDHLCRVRHCVNPAHMEPVTRKENLRRSPLMGRAQRQKSHCPQGHPYEGDNLYVDGSGRRHCRTCRREVKRRLRTDPEFRERERAKDRQYQRDYRERQAGRELAVPNAEKTHCPQGHPLTGDNVYTPPSGGRKCRICTNEANRRAYRKRKAR